MSRSQQRASIEPIPAGPRPATQRQVGPRPVPAGPRPAATGLHPVPAGPRPAVPQPAGPHPVPARPRPALPQPTGSHPVPAGPRPAPPQPAGSHPVGPSHDGTMPKPVAIGPRRPLLLSTESSNDATGLRPVTARPHLTTAGRSRAHPPTSGCVTNVVDEDDLLVKEFQSLQLDSYNRQSSSDDSGFASCDLSSAFSSVQSADSVVHRSHPELAKEKNKEKSLQKRLNNLKSKLTEQQRNKEILNDIVAGVEKEISEPTLKWERILSGSSFDKTKIGPPNEYDVMFALKSVRLSPVYHPQTGIEEKSFCFFRKSSGYPVDAFVTRDIGGAKYISPKFFKSYFRSRVQLCIHNMQRCNVAISVLKEESCNSSPAVTLQVCSNEGGRLMFTVDLVPALKIVDWPAPARSWKPHWIDKTNVEAIKNCDTLGIPKIHSSELDADPETCRFFRIAFSEHEKKVLLHADGSLNDDVDEKTCRKDVLKLVKNDLEGADFNNIRRCKGQSEEIIISSYIVKTVLLHLFDQIPDPKLWVIALRRKRYLDALGLLIKCLREMEVKHYFISSDNLLSIEMSSGRGISKAEATRLQRYFEKVAVEDWVD